MLLCRIRDESTVCVSMFCVELHDSHQAKHSEAAEHRDAHSSLLEKHSELEGSLAEKEKELAESKLALEQEIARLTGQVSDLSTGKESAETTLASTQEALAAAEQKIQGIQVTDEYFCLSCTRFCVVSASCASTEFHV